MTKLNISIVGNMGIKQKEINTAKKEVQNTLSDFKLNWTNKNPELIFFATGGSECKAKEILNTDTFCILAADEKNNSYAAATEVKAYANTHNIATHLININDPESKQYFTEYFRLKTVINNLEGKTLGLIGNVSSWLIASGMQTEQLKDTFGIELSKIAWDELPDYKEMQANYKFNSVFSDKETSKLNDSGRVYEVLKQAIADNNYDAVSTECFPLVREHKVTACLGLAKLNADGFPAGCEGDIPSAVGLMLAKELTGTVPWMANIASLTSEKTLFAHCTVAPNLIKNMNLLSHYETGEGLSIRGDFIGNEITIFRFNEDFSKIFISEGKIIARPKYDTACRTQIEAELPKESTEKLQQNPLGNHHIIIPGNWKIQLETICNIKGIEIV